MANVTTPTVSTLPVAGADIIAAPLNGWITNIKSFVEGANIDENNVDYSSADGIVVKQQTQTLTGAKTFSAAITASAGIVSGGNILSDTNSTDDLGSTSKRWANVYTDALGDTGQALGVKATTLSFDAASTIDTSGNNNLTLDAGTATLTLDAATIESDASTLSFDAAATIDTSGNNQLTINTGSANLAITTARVVVSGDLEVAGDDLFMGTNTSGHLLIADGTNYNPTALSGDITVNSSGVTAISSDVIVNADIKSDAAIADSKLATISSSNKVSGSAVQLASTTAIEDSSGLQIKSAIAGTGLSLSSQVLSVDAAQTQITSVGTLSALTVSGLITANGGLNSNNVAITGGSISGITDIAVADGGTGASTESAARTNLGVAIGSDVQAYDAGLADIAALATSDGNIIVGSGSNWVAESGATARTSLGLGSIATQAADNVSISGGSLTGMTSYSGGTISGTTGTFSSTLAVTGVSTLTGRVGVGGSTITDSHLVNIQGSTASDNVGVVLNKTNSTAQIWAINNTGTLNFHNQTTSLTPLQITSNNETTFKPSSSNGNLTVKVGSINSDSIRLEASGTTSTYLESRGYLGHSWYVDTTRKATLDATGLGLGVASPDTLLHVQSSTASDLIKVSGTGTDSNPNIQIANDARSYNLQVVGARSDAFEIWDRTAGATRLSISTSGTAFFYGGEASFGADTNNRGIVNYGSNVLALSTVQSGATYYDTVKITDGKVGIGISPTVKIHASGSSTNSALRLDESNSSASSYLGYIDTSGNFGIDINGGGYLRFAVGSAERLRIDASGLVAIGSTSPSSYSASADDFVIAKDASAVGMTIRSSSTGTGNIFFANSEASNANNGVVIFNHSTGEFSFDNYVSGSHYTFNLSNSEKLRLDATGLGVGTASPQLRLHVQDDVTGGSYNQAVGQILISGASNTNKRLNIGFDTSTDKAFLQSGINGTGYNDLLLNPNGGAVGVGTSSPSGLGQRSLNVKAPSSSGADLTIEADNGNNFGVFFSGATASDPFSVYSNTGFKFATASDKNATGFSEKMRIRTSGGITFGGATADASALDYYEEGTFSVGIAGSTSAGSATVSSTAGYYTRIGNVVHAFGFVSWNSATGTGNLKLTGLPFTSSSSGQYYPAGSMTSADLTFSHTITPYVSIGSTFMQIQQSQSGATATFVQVDASATIYFNVTYFV